MPAFLPLDAICHHVGTPLLSGDSLGVWHAHLLQETQGGVSSHRVVLLIACRGRKKKHMRSIQAMCGGIEWISISKESTKLQTVSLIHTHTHTHTHTHHHVMRNVCQHYGEENYPENRLCFKRHKERKCAQRSDQRACDINPAPTKTIGKPGKTGNCQAA